MFNSQFSIPIREDVEALQSSFRMRIENFELNIGQMLSLFCEPLLQDTSSPTDEFCREPSALHHKRKYKC